MDLHPLRRILWSSRWRRRGVVAAAVLLLLAVPALLPTAPANDLAPLLAALQASTELPVAPGDTPASGDLILRNARIVDAAGARGPAAIRIEAGRITAIGTDVDVGKGLPEVEVAGAWVMPGLMDAHVHLSMAPAAVQRKDDAVASRRLRAHHLRAYLASGVTTIFDPAVSTPVMLDIRRLLAAGHAGPRYLATGTPVVTPGSYLQHLFPSHIQGPGQVGPHLDALVKAGADGVKASYERGFAVPVWSLYPPAIEQALAVEAHARQLPVYVHAERAEMMRRGLALGPHAFVHGPIDGDERLAAQLARAQVYVITTLSLYHAQSLLLHPEQRQDPQLVRVVPPPVLASLGDPAQVAGFARGMVGEVLPFVPGRYRNLLGWLLATRTGLAQADRSARADLARAQRSVALLKRAGVPLVLGSDSGNWPMFPYFLHGPTTWRELRLLAGAGLSPAQVLAAATTNPARMLGIEQQVGTVRVGQAADLLVVDADPARDVAQALRSLRLTIRAGVARTPDAWMGTVATPVTDGP